MRFRIDTCMGTIPRLRILSFNFSSSFANLIFKFQAINTGLDLAIEQARANTRALGPVLNKSQPQANWGFGGKAPNK